MEEMNVCPTTGFLLTQDSSAAFSSSKQCWALALCSAMFDAENYREFRISITFDRDLLSIQYILLVSVYLALSMCLTSVTIMSQALLQLKQTWSCLLSDFNSLFNLGFRALTSMDLTADLL